MILNIKLGSLCLFSCLCCKIHQNLLGNLLLVNLQIFDAIYTSHVAWIWKLAQLFIPIIAIFENLRNKNIKMNSYFEFHGDRKVSTIHEFSSDDLIDVRDPPFSSHIFWIKSKTINLTGWLIDWLIDWLIGVVIYVCLVWDILSYFCKQCIKFNFVLKTFLTKCSSTNFKTKWRAQRTTLKPMEIP